MWIEAVVHAWVIDVDCNALRVAGPRVAFSEAAILLTYDVRDTGYKIQYSTSGAESTLYS